MSDAPMSYFSFHRYISNSQKQSDWIDNLYKCDIDGIADKIVSYDDESGMKTFLVLTSIKFA